MPQMNMQNHIKTYTFVPLTSFSTHTFVYNFFQLERQCRDLHSEQQESRLENVKLKMTNEELSHELEHTCQELVLAQEQLGILQEQASRLQQEREMSVCAFIVCTQWSHQYL